MAAVLYHQCVPVLVKYLNNLSHIVQKATAFCQDKGVKEEELLNYRLVPDMRG